MALPKEALTLKGEWNLERITRRGHGVRGEVLAENAREVKARRREVHSPA